LKSDCSKLSLFRAFYHERILNFIKCSFCIFWGYYVIFILDSIYVLYYVYWFVFVKPSLHPWNDTSLIMLYDLLNVLLNSICTCFVVNFCIYVILVYSFLLLFCYYCVLVRFWSQGNSGFIEWIWEGLLPSHFVT
jgi:hypothetical protein